MKNAFTALGLSADRETFSDVVMKLHPDRLRGVSPNVIEWVLSEIKSQEALIRSDAEATVPQDIRDRPIAVKKSALKAGVALRGDLIACAVV